MLDTSVPLKWRLYGLINGFWINGLTVYAANKFFSDKLNCAERTISYALAELEKDKLVRREINGYKRVIHPYGTVSEQGATPLQGGSNPVAGKGATPLQPNASSIAPNKNTSVSNETRVYEITEGNTDTERPKKESRAKYPHSKEVFSWFPHPEKAWTINTTECKYAELLYERGETAVKKALVYHEKHKDDEGYGYVIVKPSQLEGKWNDIAEYARRTK